ncbi:zeta toxin family protein [Gilliamella sp. B2865]|uniref:zeta toxin family protein n=1 Tax=unclassified Gilliamella TaxID=2685620 RepID=UPI0008105D4B|nr:MULTISPECIES: zeta toxin family protein [Gilliamella]MCX8671350.1 zeta toxin family protein [Gilliamella sp. B2785]MCX8679728.1 zeta toxin family protein [Gilliamella sp. B2865]OCL24350.1 hypothetical protein A9G07_05830 [Gilliamella apicola]
MKNNEQLSHVSNQEKNHIVNDIWIDIHIEQPELTSQQNPKAYVVGGQPGAGKSTFTNKLQTEYSNNILIIDLDSYRERHPNYKTLYEKYGKESSEYTHQFASEIKEEIQKRAIDAKYNIIIDGTLKNINKAEKKINDLKNNGYSIDVLIHICPKEVSWQSVNIRYEKALKQGRIPRYVPKNVHDQVVEALPVNANKLSQSTQIESLTVYNRQEKIYDSKIDKGLPSVSIQNEINKDENKLSQDESFAKLLQTAKQNVANKKSIRQIKDNEKDNDMER